MGNDILKGARRRLEFPVLDYLATVDVLEPPLVMVFGPPGSGGVTGHCESIYPDEDAPSIITQFIRRCSATADFAKEIEAHILMLIQQRASPGRILVISVVPPIVQPVLQVSARDTAGSSDEETALISS